MEPEEHLRRRTSAAKDIAIGGPESRLDREPPLKRQFDHANDSNRPLEKAQEDPAKARALERVNERAQRFEGTSLAESPVLTNEFEKFSAKRASHEESREEQERRPKTPDRDAVLRAAMERAQSSKKQPTSAQAKEIKPEFNQASGKDQAEIPRSGQQGQHRDQSRDEAISAAFKRATKALENEDANREQSGSQMVREDQPKHLMHPPKETREPSDRASYEKRLMDEFKKELAKQEKADERSEWTNDQNDGPRREGQEMSR